MSESVSPEEIKRNRRKFLIVFAVFLAPVGLAWALYFSGWRPTSTINHGTLVQPARPLGQFVVLTPSGKRFSHDDMKGKWSLILIAPKRCDETCRRNVYSIRQIHTAQGKNQHRVERYLIHGADMPQAERRQLAGDYPNMHVLAASKQVLRNFSGWMGVGEAGNPFRGARIFVIDPLGNYMMYYPPGAEPKGMRKDLSRLLRVSHVG